MAKLYMVSGSIGDDDHYLGGSLGLKVAGRAAEQRKSFQSKHLPFQMRRIRESVMLLKAFIKNKKTKIYVGRLRHIKSNVKKWKKLSSLLTTTSK